MTRTWKLFSLISLILNFTVGVPQAEAEVEDIDLTLFAGKKIMTDDIHIIKNFKKSQAIKNQLETGGLNLDGKAVIGFVLTGSTPLFLYLEGDPASEDEYQGFWKAVLASLAGSAACYVAGALAGPVSGVVCIIAIAVVVKNQESLQGIALEIEFNHPIELNDNPRPPQGDKGNQSNAKNSDSKSDSTHSAASRNKNENQLLSADADDSEEEESLVDSIGSVFSDAAVGAWDGIKYVGNGIATGADYALCAYQTVDNAVECCLKKYVPGYQSVYCPYIKDYMPSQWGVITYNFVYEILDDDK